MKVYLHRGLNILQMINVEFIWFLFNKDKHKRFYKLVNYHCISGFGAYRCVKDEFKNKK